MIVLAAVCALSALVLFARALVGGDTRWVTKRLAPHVAVGSATPQVQVHQHLQRASRHPRVDALLDATERRLRGRAWNAFCARVERADVPLRPVELVYVGGAAVLLTAVLGAAVVGPIALVLAPALVGLIVRSVLAIRAQRRLKAFEEQLPDVLATIAGSLRAGHGFLQSLQAVSTDAPEPARKEFRRVLAETRLGRPLEDALADLGRRLPAEDLLFVLTSVAVQRQVGGSLAHLFETVNDVVRQRQHFARKVRALTATGRASAQLLAVLPAGLLLLLTAIDHSYTAPLFETQVGRMLLAGSACSTILGSIVLRRIASLKGVVR